MNPLQSALEAIAQATANDPDSGVLAALARGLMFGYDHRWQSARWQTVAVEQEYHLPIINPDSERSSRTFTHAGKIDVIAAFEDRNFMVEHKTCSEDIADPNAPYWQRLDIDSQVSGYILAKWQSGVKLDGTLYDVIRKPGIRPKQLTKEALKEIILQKKYCGFDLSKEDTAKYAAGGSEDDFLFGMRVATECLKNPDYYFARKTVFRLDNQILDFARELWQTADEIRLARVYSRHYRNSQACMQWNRPCMYLGLCSGRDQPDSGKWSRRTNVHEELSTLEGDGRDVLTLSRMNTFKTCKKKHELRYEIGLERIDKEEAEATYFGTIMHAALAAWWRALIPQTKEPVCLP